MPPSLKLELQTEDIGFCFSVMLERCVYVDELLDVKEHHG